MSLQTCPNCKKTNQYWRIYREINCKHFKKGMSIKCSFCNNDMKADIEKKSKIQMIISGLLWIGFPVSLIFLAYYKIINYPTAMIVVILFHFGAMYYLIKTMNYKK